MKTSDYVRKKRELDLACQQTIRQYMFGIRRHPKKKGVPAGTPPVADLAGFCNSITEHIIHRRTYFVNTFLPSVYAFKIVYAGNDSLYILQGGNLYKSKNGVKKQRRYLPHWKKIIMRILTRCGISRRRTTGGSSLTAPCGRSRGTIWFPSKSDTIFTRCEILTGGRKQ